MKDVRLGWMRSARATRRGAGVAGWLLLGAIASGLPGCEERRSKLDEAVEEIEDEAKDAREEIEDEIDDHT